MNKINLVEKINKHINNLKNWKELEKDIIFKENVLKSKDFQTKEEL